MLNGKTLDLINNTPKPNTEYKSLEEEFKEFIGYIKPDGSYGKSQGLKNIRDYEWNIFEKGEYCFKQQ